MTAVAATNGHAPVSPNPYAQRDEHLSSGVAAEIESLRRLLDAELEGRAEIEALLDNSKERERRLARAIAILEHGSQTQQQAAAAAAKPKPAAKDTTNWNVSAETVERVREAFFAYYATEGEGEPFTMTTLAAWMGKNRKGIGGETIRRAFEVLRRDEIIRVCGTTRGGGKMFAPMPEQQQLNAA